MINSMTGYGCAEGEFDGLSYVVELRTVNSRYFKTRLRLPETLAFLEEDIERLLRQSLSRGTINCVVRLKNAPAEALVNINETTLQSYLGKLAAAAASAGMECPIDVAGLLVLPGVMQPVCVGEEKAEQIKEKILSITAEAIEQLKQMRGAEGAALAADLESHCQAIRQDLVQIRNHSGAVLRQYQKKLKKRVDELLANGKLKLDEATLAREVAVFADRSDVAEELARLDSHLQRFTECCREDEQAGRRLDFISQEMLREANTIASKASDTEIVNWVVDIKCRIDRIKEQVQNIE